MELIEGECLQDSLERGGLDEALALRVVVQIAQALTYLHGRGLVHRDVKPGNILLTPQGRAVLIDLGSLGLNRLCPQGLDHSSVCPVLQDVPN